MPHTANHTSYTQEELIDILGPQLAQDLGVTTSTSGLSGFLGRLGGLNLGDIAQTGLSAAALNDAMRRLSGVGEGLAQGAERVAAEASEASQFKPFTVTTGFGTIGATPEGGYTTTLDPTQAAQQQQLQAATTGLLGGLTGSVPDVSAIQTQALGGVTDALTAAQQGLDTRVADVFERIRAVQRPEEERQQLALQEQLQAQGRTGLRTAQFGGSPEQLALAQAREEAKNRAALSAITQAQAEQQQALEQASGLFGLGASAAGLPAALTTPQLENIRTSLGSQYIPEQQLLSTISPAINLANIAGTGQRQGAGYLAQGGISGLEALAQTELARANLLGNLYSGLLAGGGRQSAQESLFSSIFGDSNVQDILSGLFS